MIRRLGRLFSIKTRFEAFAVIYAIALGAVERGMHYLQIYPGWSGSMMFVACTTAVFVAGGKILDTTAPKRKQGEERRSGDRRAASRTDAGTALSNQPS